MMLNVFVTSNLKCFFFFDHEFSRTSLLKNVSNNNNNNINTREFSGQVHIGTWRASSHQPSPIKLNSILSVQFV